MKLKTIALALAWSAFAIPASQALQITDFGDVGFEIIDDFTTFATVTPNSMGISVSGSASGDSLVGTFAPVDIAGLYDITLTGSVSGGNPAVTFRVLLFDITLIEYREYSGITIDFGVTSTTVLLTLVSETAEFTEIGGFQFISDGGDTLAPLSFTFESVDAIPEPSVYMLTSVGLAGAYLLRRRSKI